MSYDGMLQFCVVGMLCRICQTLLKWLILGWGGEGPKRYRAAGREGQSSSSFASGEGTGAGPGVAVPVPAKDVQYGFQATV